MALKRLSWKVDYLLILILIFLSITVISGLSLLYISYYSLEDIGNLTLELLFTGSVETLSLAFLIDLITKRRNEVDAENRLYKVTSSEIADMIKFWKTAIVQSVMEGSPSDPNEKYEEVINNKDTLITEKLTSKKHRILVPDFHSSDILNPKEIYKPFIFYTHFVFKENYRLINKFSDKYSVILTPEIFDLISELQQLIQKHTFQHDNDTVDLIMMNFDGTDIDQKSTTEDFKKFLIEGNDKIKLLERFLEKHKMSST